MLTAGPSPARARMDDRRGISTGSNSRPLNDTVAETGGGIPDDAVVDGELAPGEIGEGAEQAVEALERAGWTHPAKDAARSETGA